jgi:hypothetical protein
MQGMIGSVVSILDMEDQYGIVPLGYGI